MKNIYNKIIINQKPLKKIYITRQSRNYKIILQKSSDNNIIKKLNKISINKFKSKNRIINKKSSKQNIITKKPSHQSTITRKSIKRGIMKNSSNYPLLLVFLSTTLKILFRIITVYNYYLMILIHQSHKCLILLVPIYFRFKISKINRLIILKNLHLIS